MHRLQTKLTLKCNVNKLQISTNYDKLKFMEKLHIIVNKISGKNRGGQCLAEVVEFLDSQKIEYEVHVTLKQGDAELLARSLTQNGAKIIAALGGDGTFHEVLNGMDFTSGAALGFISAGRGDDYARGIGIKSDPIEAVKDILRGEITYTDYINIGGRRCLNVGGSGLDVSVLERTENKNTSLSYIAALAHCLLAFKPFQFSVSCDNGNEFDGKAIMVGACNGKQFGGGIKICPASRNNDGLIDVVIMTKPKYLPCIFAMPNFIKGKHLDKNYTRHFQCTRLNVKTDCPLELDGEIYRNLEFDATIVPNGVRTFKISNDI